MENSLVKTRKRRIARSGKVENTVKTVSEEDVRKRAFEIYLENGSVSHNEIDDWLRAERELKGYDQY
jgi:hypothetical protein